MPTNLPAEALSKWEEVQKARTPEERLRKLQEFYALVPKHKGTEKLLKQVRRKIARLREEVVSKRERRRSTGFFVEKSGDIQIVLFGFTNSGRSTVLNKLTGRKVKISPSPFTTVNKPETGVFTWNGVSVQVVEAPPVIENLEDTLTSRALALVRNADSVAITLDASSNPVSQLLKLGDILRKGGISLKRPKVYVSVEPNPSRNGNIIRIRGKLRGCTLKDVERALAELGIRNKIVTIHGEADLNSIEEYVTMMLKYKPPIIIMTKLDTLTHEEADSILEKIRGVVRDTLVIDMRRDLNSVKSEITEYLMQKLELIRVYTWGRYEKQPANRPIVVKKGSTVLEIAGRVHSSLHENFRYALVWRRGDLGRRPVKVGKGYVVEDLDIIRIVGT
ncbi:MAG: hypothetical protein DRN99_04735 [Thermoproteota archaeon]|nr:MAG: hypothetical protein DRN99_04735 [Candidatus Korarchaeota archaeon]